MKTKFFVLSSILLSPVAMISARYQNDAKNIGGLTYLVGSIVAGIIPIASMLAILFFFYGLAMYILKAGDPKAADEGKSIMIWGIIAIFVMTSIYGIVGFIQRSAGMDRAAISNPVVVPDFVPSNAGF